MTSKLETRSSRLLLRRVLLFSAAGAVSAAVTSSPSVAAEGGDELERSVTVMARIGSAGSPAFSPDGKRLAFVSNLSGLPQIWVMDSGGFPQAVTSSDDPVGSVAWSPDGAWLAFTLAPGGGMKAS